MPGLRRVGGVLAFIEDEPTNLDISFRLRTQWECMQAFFLRLGVQGIGRNIEIYIFVGGKRTNTKTHFFRGSEGLTHPKSHRHAVYLHHVHVQRDRAVITMFLSVSCETQRGPVRM